MIIAATSDWWRLPAIILLALPLAVWELGSGSFAVPKWVGLYLLASAMLVHLAWRGKTIELDHIDGFVAALIGWAFFSLSWSPDREQGLEQIVHLSALWSIFLGARYLSWPGEMLPVAAAAALAAALICLIMLPSGYHGGFGNENFLAIFILSALPMATRACYQVIRRTADVIPAIALALLLPAFVLGYLLLIHPAKTEWPALMIGFTLLFLVRRKWLLAILTIWLSIPVVYWLLESGADFTSLMQRAELALNTLVMVSDAPLMGHGFGSYNYVYPAYQNAHLLLLGDVNTLPTSATMAGAAHNEYLQVAAELGVVGLALSAAIVASVFLYRPEMLNPAAIVTVCVVMIMSLYEFPLQMPATAVLFALSLGVMTRRPI